MIKQSRLLCDNCNIFIKLTRAMTNEEWNTLSESSPILCPKCEAPIRLKELERARKYLTSDYYWDRVKELNADITGEFKLNDGRIIK